MDTSTRRRFLCSSILTGAGCLAGQLQAQAETGGIRIATFRSDVTPPIGSPLCAGFVKPVAGVTEPLQALGLVILGDDKPIVLCAVDWCEIRAGDHVRWRETLAQAAGTTPERVAVHCLHQHNAPLADTSAQAILAATAAPVNVIDEAFMVKALAGVAASLEKALKQTTPATHLTIGEAKVDKVASNRRIMGDNGKVAKVRLSSTKDPVLRELPEGTIDPMLKTIAVWNGDKKLAVLHYYATHPMSFYGDGMVTHDFVGIARERRARDESVPHVYFTGCGGNIAAGKYNDGSLECRVQLGENIYAAMVESEKQPKRVSLNHVKWHTKPVLLTPDPEFGEERMMKVINNTKTTNTVRIEAALRLAFMRQCAAGVPIQFTSLELGDEVRLLHLPGESFIEYQLFAQKLVPGKFVATASYGDGGPGYIPLERSFAEGGYEPTEAFAAPNSETEMRTTITTLLQGQP